MSIKTYTILYVIAITIFLSFLCSKCEGQCNLRSDTTILVKESGLLNFEWKNKKYTGLERNIYGDVVLAGLIISDVFLYKAVEGTRYVDFYRMLQGALQLGISYVLAKEFGLSSAIGFNIQLLFSVNDYGYYLFFPREKVAPFSHLGLNPFYIANGGRMSVNDLNASAFMGMAIKWSINF